MTNQKYNGNDIFNLKMNSSVTTPFWGKCEDETHTPKSENLEPSKTFKNSELDYKGQNTFHWGVLYTVGKLLKCRCPKWSQMSDLDICSTSYGLKKRSGIKLAIWLLTTKSQESTWSRCVQVDCDTPLESSWEEIQIFLRPHPNRRSKLGVMTSQSIGSPNWDNFGIPLWESWDKKPFGCRWRGQTQRIIYGGRWCLCLSPGRGESCESKVARGLS
jgi:hypothetical protein